MTDSHSTPLPTILTIAGSDCSAGAGIQADLKTISALGGYGLTVPTAITAQNSRGVQSVLALPDTIIRAQLQALFDDYQIDAIKIGMLANQAILETLLEFLQQYPVKNIVLDPILISSSGHPLLEPSAIDLLKKALLPQVSLLTPNLPEVNVLLQQHFRGAENEIRQIATDFFRLGVPAVVIKGGHSAEQEQQATDYLVMRGEKVDTGEVQENQFIIVSTPRVKTPHTHGTGCTFSSAIATELAKGQTLPVAVQNAKHYLYQTLVHADLGQPHYQRLEHSLNSPRNGGLNHFYHLAAANAAH